MSNGMSLAALEKADSSSVWVLNNTNPKGIVSFLTDSGMGSNVTLNVPLTWIPFDVTTQATKKSLLNNPQFRRIVSMGVLKILSDDEANSLLSGSDAREEQKRVFNLEAVGYTNLQDKIPTEIQAEVESSNISGLALALAIDADTTPEKALLDLRVHQESFTLEDWKYLKDNAVLPAIKQVAEKRLAELSRT